MAQALALPESKVLAVTSLSTFGKDSYAYKVVKTKGGSTFTVSETGNGRFPHPFDGP